MGHVHLICMYASTGKDIDTKEIILHRNQSYEGVSGGNTVMQPCPAYGMYHWPYELNVPSVAMNIYFAVYNTMQSKYWVQV